MTVENLVKRIESYPTGFEFTIPYNQMTEKQKWGMNKVLKIAQNKNLIESVGIGAGWDRDGSFNCFQNETFRRI